MGQLRRTSFLGLMALALGLAILLGYGSVHPGALQTALAQSPKADPGLLTNPLPLVGGTFEDPQQRFKIGILDGYVVSQAGSSPLFQAPDGNLAYTVVISALAPNSPDPLPDVVLLQLAKDTFGQGEGFQTTGLKALPGGGLQIDWSGRLSQGSGPPSPVEGRILAKQRGTEMFLLLVAGVKAGIPQLQDAIATLGSSLTVP